MSDINQRIETVSAKIAELHRFLATPPGQISQIMVQKLITMLETRLAKLHEEKLAEIPEKVAELARLRQELAKLEFEVERDSGLIDKVSEKKINEFMTVVDNTLQHIIEDAQRLEDLTLPMPAVKMP